MFPASERFLSASLFLCFVVACDPSATRPAEFIDRAPDVATTSGEVAMRNLSSNIDAMRRALARTGSFDAASRLVDSLLTRARYTGSYSDFSEAQDLAAELTRDSRRFEPLVLRARVRSALHDFSGAERDLTDAEALGADDISTPRSTIFLARGEQLDHVFATRSDALEVSRNFRTLSDMAAVTAVLGRFDEADALFVEALTVYRDVSPFAVAWVHFQRGVMWAEQADRPDIGRSLYERAVQILPDYVVANVHLAELEFLDGDVAQATARLEALHTLTEDPEPTGLLAEFIQLSAPTRASGLAADARRVYNDLLSRYPLAFLDHASEFFAGPGQDPARSVRLALQNLDHRKNHRAYIVAIEAALASGQPSLACELADEATTLVGENENLTSLVQTVLPSC